MFGGARILLTISACVLATPVTAQAPAPATTAFDGTYAGVSREMNLTGTGRGRQCEPPGVPDSLTITNGVVRSAGGFEGAVTPQGAVTLRRPDAFRIDGQIDAQGTIRGSGSGTGGCVNTCLAKAVQVSPVVANASSPEVFSEEPWLVGREYF
jgi:hypothetical protein